MKIRITRDRLAVLTALGALVAIGIAGANLIASSNPPRSGQRRCSAEDINGYVRFAVCAAGTWCCIEPQYDAGGNWINLPWDCCVSGDNCWTSQTDAGDVYVWCGTLSDDPGGPATIPGVKPF